MSDNTDGNLAKTGPAPSAHPRSTAARFIRRLVLGASSLALLLWCLPWLAAATPLRDFLIRAAIANPNLSVTSRGASFGWLSPARIDGLRLARQDGQAEIDIRRIETDKPWLQIWRDLPEVGEITVEQPRLRIVSPLPATPEAAPQTRPSREPPTLSVIIRQAALTVVVPPQEQPVIDLDDLDLAVHVERVSEGRRLRIDPSVVFDHRQLTPEMCDRGLQLFAPVLADATRVAGEVSLQVDRFEMPLDQPPNAPLLEQVELSGQLHLHQVTTGMKNPLLREIAQLVAGLLRIEMPQQIRIADDAVVRFTVQDGKVFHEGLAFGLPGVSSELVIRTSGTVGLDESLDLLVEIPLPLNLLANGPIARRISERPLALRVSGTLSDPKVGLPEGESVLQDLASRLLNDPGAAGQEGDLASSILDVVGGLIESRRNENGQVETPLLDRLRQRRVERAEGRASEPEGPGELPPRRPGLLRRRGAERYTPRGDE